MIDRFCSRFSLHSRRGLDRDEYQLQRVIDVEALERVVDSAKSPQADTDLEIRFSVSGSVLKSFSVDIQKSHSSHRVPRIRCETASEQIARRQEGFNRAG